MSALTGKLTDAATGSALSSVPASDGQAEKGAGISRPQPGGITPPRSGRLPIRPIPFLEWASGPRNACWFVGCHGGAGVTTLATATGQGGVNAGRYWPVPEAPGTAMVVLVARTHATGLRAAQLAARQWASGALDGDVRLLGLAAVADAPGRLPKPLRDLLHLVSGAFPQVWTLPWAESLRLGAPPDLGSLPAAYAAMAADCSG